MTAEELSRLKAYMRVDGNDEDASIAAMSAAAEQYMSNAGIVEDRDSALWTMCRNVLVLHYYDARGEMSMLPAGVQTMLNQLKLEGLCDDA